MKALPSKALAIALAVSLTSFVPAAAFADEATDEELEVKLAQQYVGDMSGGVSLDEAAGIAASLAGKIDAAGGPSLDLLATKDYWDCDVNDWYASSLDYASEKGFILGFPDGSFRPYDNVTRGQLVTIIWRMEGEPASPERNGFADVSSSDYYYEAVNWAAAYDIVHGFTEDGVSVFAPENAITRQEVAIVLRNYAALKGRDVRPDFSTLYTMSDWRTCNTWATDALGWATDKGLMTGIDRGSYKELDPHGTAWRSAIAKMITVLDRDVLGNAAPPAVDPGNSQEQAEQRVLGIFKQSFVNADAGGWNVVISEADDAWDRCFLVMSTIDLSYSDIRFGYKYSSDVRTSLNEIANTLDDLSASMYEVSVSEGANLDVRVCMYSSDGEPIYATVNGVTSLPYWYILQ